MGRSSEELGWDALVIESRTAPSIERPEIILDQPYILVSSNRKPWICERPGLRGAGTIRHPGTLALGPSGVISPVRMSTPYRTVACLLNPRILAEIEAEMDTQPAEEARERTGVDDASLAQLVRLAAREVHEQGAAGRLYADSLAHAISVRFLHAARALADFDEGRLHPLPRYRLRRVLDKINSEFDRDLSLAALATVSGYSRTHFLRTFRAAMGKSPHRYLIDIRLDHALRQLDLGNISISEVAHSSGFSSHSHLTKTFRERFGVTPSVYRRDKTT